MKDWRVPVLTYHGLHAPGWDYHENDHVALEQDLGLIDELGFKVVPLSVLVNHLFCREDARLESGKFVAISFDDGSDFDTRIFRIRTGATSRVFETCWRTGRSWAGMAALPGEPAS